MFYIYNFFFESDEHTAINPRKRGTKVGALYVLTVPAGGKVTIQSRMGESPLPDILSIGRLFARRIEEADQFYSGVKIIRCMNIFCC